MIIYFLLMLIINNYDYLLRKYEIKTLLYSGKLKELSFFGEQIYQLGVAPNSVFFKKDQLKKLLLANDSLVFSYTLSFWELYLEEIHRTCIIWKYYQRFFLSRDFNLAVSNLGAFIPFSYTFFKGRCDPKIGLFIIGESQPKLLPDSFWKCLVSAWAFRLKKKKNKLSKVWHVKVKGRRRRRRKSLNKRINNWSKRLFICGIRSNLFVFVSLLLFRRQWRRWPIVHPLNILSINRPIKDSKFLTWKYPLRNELVLPGFYSYLRIIFSISFWKFFKKITKKIKKKRIKFFEDNFVDETWFEYLLFYWFFIVFSFFKNNQKLCFFLSWYFTSFGGKYIRVYCAKHYFKKLRFYRKEKRLWKRRHHSLKLKHRFLRKQHCSKRRSFSRNYSLFLKKDARKCQSLPLSLFTVYKKRLALFRKKK